MCVCVCVCVFTPVLFNLSSVACSDTKDPKMGVPAANPTMPSSASRAPRDSELDAFDYVPPPRTSKTARAGKKKGKCNGGEEASEVQRGKESSLDALEGLLHVQRPHRHRLVSTEADPGMPPPLWHRAGPAGCFLFLGVVLLLGAGSTSEETPPPQDEMPGAAVASLQLSVSPPPASLTIQLPTATSPPPPPPPPPARLSPSRTVAVPMDVASAEQQRASSHNAAADATAGGESQASADREGGDREGVGGQEGRASPNAAFGWMGAHTYVGQQGRTTGGGGGGGGGEAGAGGGEGGGGGDGSITVGSATAAVASQQLHPGGDEPPLVVSTRSESSPPLPPSPPPSPAPSASPAPSPPPPPRWELHRGRNCWWGGHGADEIDVPAGSAVVGIDSLASCQASCVSLESFTCEGILWRKSPSMSLSGACYRKANLVPSECSDDAGFDLWMRNDLPTPPQPPPAPPPAHPSPPSEPGAAHMRGGGGGVAAINGAFRNSKLGGDIAEAGLLLHQFDEIESQGHPWQMCERPS